MKTAATHTTAKNNKASNNHSQKENGHDFFGNRSSPPSFFPSFNTGTTAVQCKLTIGKPGDRYEKEADSMADKVVQKIGTREQAYSAGSDTGAKPVAGLHSPVIQNKCAECEKEEQLKKKEEEQEGPRPVQRKPIFESNAEKEQDVVRRKCEHCELEEKNLQRKENGSSATVASPSVESQISGSKGKGSPLPAGVNQSMSDAFGTDFSNVRVHTDSSAAQMSKDLNAQAFTHGNDIYFNDGKFDTASAGGKHLLAHELTHTMQQGSSVRKKDDKKDDKKKLEQAKDADPQELKDNGVTQGSHKGYITRSGKTLELHMTKLETKKYLTKDDTKILTRPIKLPKASEERKTRQIQKWKSVVKDKVEEHLTKNYSGKEGVDGDLSLTVNKRKETGVIGNLKQLAGEASIPFWSIKGNPRVYDVEHMIDWQIAGNAHADTPENLILLDRTYNRSLGNVVKKNIEEHINAILTKYRKNYKGIPAHADSALASISVFVDDFKLTGEELDSEKRYDKEDITDFDFDKGPYGKKKILVKDAEIPNGMFLLKTSESRAGYLIPYNRTETIGAWKITSEFDKKTKKLISLEFEMVIKGNNVVKAGKEDGAKEGRAPIKAGEKQVKKLSMSFDEEKNLVYKIKPRDLKQQYGSALKELYINGMSPIQFDEPEIDGLDASVTGKILPTISFLKDVDISFAMDNGEFIIQAEVPLDKLAANFPKPFKVNSCSLIVAASTVRGLSLYGNINFELGKFGEGDISAGINSKDGIFLDGTFSFNSKWFDPAEINFGYRKGEWTIGGKIGLIPGLVKGVKTANLTISYAKGAFNATGIAELTVPGVKSVTLSADVDDKGNFAFMAEVALGKLPGIKAGNVKVTVKNKEGGEELKLRVEGKATPDFPSVKELSGDIEILYDDGIFDARLKIIYKKGRFDGTIEIGVTNKQVDDKGKPMGEGNEKGDVVVFGYGSLTVDLFKNIKGTVTARLTPEKELLVAGDIEAKDLKPFGEGYHPPDKELLKFPRITIPLIGLPGLSISAFVDGGVYFKFSWDPLVLKQLKVGFQEININEIENATFEIHGSVGSMASAEVYMTIKAGLEGRALIATLSGSIGGEAGLGINAEAGGELDAAWNKDKGLQFKELRAFLNVVPHAVFRLTGDVSVDLDLWITTVNLYYHKWVFAEKQLDLGALTLKADFPIKFDEDNNLILPSLDQVNLQKPDFTGAQGKDILDKAINGDSEKELEQKKQEIKAEIKKSLREKYKDEDFSFSDYKDSMVEKYGKSPELKEFVLKTIEDESRAMEYERFEETKSMIRSLQVPLANKVTMVKMMTMFNRYITEADTQAFLVELANMELEKQKEEQAKKETPASQVDNKVAVSDNEPEPARAAAPAPDKIQRKSIFESDEPVQRKEETAGNGIIQRSPDTDMDGLYQKALDDKNWPKVAEYLNGFNREDITSRLSGKSNGTIAAIHAGALENPAVGPNAQIAQLTRWAYLEMNFNNSLLMNQWSDAAMYLNGMSRDEISKHLTGKNTGIVAALYAGALENPGVGPNSQVAELTRWAFLEMNFKNELAKKQWRPAAMYLNGFNDADINKYLVTITVEIKINLRNEAIPAGYPAVVKNIDADAGFQAAEKLRIAKLEDDYNTAIANKNWNQAALLLEAYNDEDIQLKLLILNVTSPDEVKQIRSAADNMREGTRVGKFAQELILGSSNDKDKLLMAGVLMGDVWMMQFIKGIETSGLGARMGEGWEKVKQNLSDPKNAATFIGGIYIGYPVGVIKDLVDNIVGIVELAWSLVKLQVEATFEPDKLIEEIVKALKPLPALIMKVLNGEEMGYQMGLYLSRTANKEFIQKGPFEQGMLIGEIIGRINTEIALLFVGVEEVSAVAKSLKATKWGAAVAEALEASKFGKALMEAKGAGKIVKGAETLTLDAEKMENALAKMARIEEKAPAITEDMMKLEQRVLSDRVAKGNEIVKPLEGGRFDAELTIEQHSYKRVEADKSWCRFSPGTPQCDLHLPEEVEKSVDNQILSKEEMEQLSKTDYPPGYKKVNPKTSLGTFVHSKEYTKFCRWLETSPGRQWLSKNGLTHADLALDLPKGNLQREFLINHPEYTFKPRADVVDMDNAVVHEIKPMGSEEIGFVESQQYAEWMNKYHPRDDGKRWVAGKTITYDGQKIFDLFKKFGYFE